MAKKAKTRARRKRKQSGGSGAATLILLTAIGVGLFIGIVGFEAGASAGDAARATGMLN